MAANDKSGKRGGSQPLNSGSRADLQREISERYFLAHCHARDVDRYGRPSGLGLPPDRELYRVSLGEASRLRNLRQFFFHSGENLLDVAPGRAIDRQ